MKGQELNQFILISEDLEETLGEYASYGPGDDFLSDHSGNEDAFGYEMLQHQLTGERHPITKKHPKWAFYDVEEYEYAIIGLLPGRPVPTSKFAGRLVSGATGHSLGAYMLREIRDWWERRNGHIGDHTDGITHARNIVRRERLELIHSARTADSSMLAAFTEVDAGLYGEESTGKKSVTQSELRRMLDDVDNRTIQRYSNTAGSIKKRGRGAEISINDVMKILREIQENEDGSDRLKKAASNAILRLSNER